MYKPSSRFKWAGVTAVLSSLVLAACGGGGGGGSSTPTGTLGVSLTDDACGFSAVNVTVTKVRVHQSATATENDAGWSDLTLSPAQKINLVTLTNGVLMDLGQIPLPAGHYTQIRLLLDSNTPGNTVNSVVPTGSQTEIPIDTPSAIQTGIKLINQFDVAAGQRADVVLDFNACKSVVKRGNGTYLLMPVVSVVPITVNGIDGFVNTALLPSNVTVTAQQGGTVVDSTVPNAQTGEFFLARLPAGNYDVVLTADNHVTGVVATVPVTATGTVVLSTSASPINLPASTSTPATHNASGTVTLNPAATTSEAGYVSAQQTPGTGPTVTVKSQSLDLTSGPASYSLALPVDAPVLGTFGTLPIALSPQAAAAGKYTIAASATGYTTQTANVTVSTADVTQNFTLVP